MWKNIDKLGPWDRFASAQARLKPSEVFGEGSMGAQSQRNASARAWSNAYALEKEVVGLSCVFVCFCTVFVFLLGCFLILLCFCWIPSIFVFDRNGCPTHFF